MPTLMDFSYDTREVKKNSIFTKTLYREYLYTLISQENPQKIVNLFQFMENKGYSHEYNG